MFVHHRLCLFFWWHWLVWWLEQISYSLLVRKSLFNNRQISSLHYQRKSSRIRWRILSLWKVWLFFRFIHIETNYGVFLFFIYLFKSHRKLLIIFLIKFCNCIQKLLLFALFIQVSIWLKTMGWYEFFAHWLESFSKGYVRGLNFLKEWVVGYRWKSRN